ncbi:Fip1 motif [Popillia japonica]|uniref:Fip1 motif n=1 Tax=Popillia japonica TaxID=7064 RepID=A0AAW1L8A4_POPJA
MAEDLDNDDKWLYGESNDALGAENENVPEQNGYTVKVTTLLVRKMKMYRNITMKMPRNLKHLKNCNKPRM